MSTLLMVSGASRGLGRAIATAFAESPLLPTSVTVEAVLLARSDLSETTRSMKASRPSWRIYEYSVDLGNLDTLEESMKPIFDRHAFLSTRTTSSSPLNRTLVSPDKAILINCAGTTGYIGLLPTSLQEIKQATDLNFTSKAWMTARFLQTFSQQKDDDSSPTTVVNVSSMCAVKPTPTMALYCATSVAREMYHTVLGMDNKRSEAGGGPRILNYAPGSCDTDMQRHLRNHDKLDPAVQAYCQSLVTDGGLVRCEDTAAELVRRVLEPNAFHSGERVEFVCGSTYKY